MNVPSTPTPSSATSGQTTAAPLLQQTKTDMSLPPSSSTTTAIQSIYAETFSVVGNEFLSILVRELARCTQSQHVLIYQLMTRQDYNEMEKHSPLPPSSMTNSTTERSPVGSPHHQATSSSSSSSRGRSSKSQSNEEEEVLMIRASHSSLPHL